MPLNYTRDISIFSKICGDIRKSRCTTIINDTCGKFATGINDSGINFATSSAGVVDTGGKFATVVNNAGGKLPPVSVTLVANNGDNTRLLAI